MTEVDTEDQIDSRGGCLGALLRLFGIRVQPAEIQSTEKLPYQVNRSLLTPAELSLFNVLQQVVPPEFILVAKPRIADVFFVPRGTKGKWAFENKIRSKHFDFLICHRDTMTPRLAVELDDRSHDRPDRRERDSFVDEAAKAAGLAILHVAAKTGYVPADLKKEVLQTLSVPAAPTVAAPSRPASGTRRCPKCGTPMMKRIASKGVNRGNAFWGCSNYPNCRETAPVE